MKPRICQSKRKDGNPCNGNALGGGYYCYVHQNSKDPITHRDPLLEATRALHDSIISLIDWHYCTAGDISRLFGNSKLVAPPEKNPYLKQTNLNKRHTSPKQGI